MPIALTVSTQDLERLFHKHPVKRTGSEPPVPLPIFPAEHAVQGCCIAS